MEKISFLMIGEKINFTRKRYIVLINFKLFLFIIKQAKRLIGPQTLSTNEKAIFYLFAFNLRWVNFSRVREDWILIRTNSNYKITSQSRSSENYVCLMDLFPALFYRQFSHQNSRQFTSNGWILMNFFKVLSFLLF